MPPRAVRLRDRPQRGRAHLDRARVGGLRVGDVEHQADGAPAERLRAEVLLLGELAGEHEDGVADAHLGVTDPAVGHDDRITEEHGVEHVRVPLDGTPGRWWRGRA